MGWSIGLIEDTITFTKEGAEAFEAIAEELGLDAPGENDDGSWSPYFNPDHMEHMDFLWQDEVLVALKLGKANGRALFGSLEGDNDGEFWGYEFKDGEMTKLTGKIAWKKAKAV